MNNLDWYNSQIVYYKQKIKQYKRANRQSLLMLNGESLKVGDIVDGGKMYGLGTVVETYGFAAESCMPLTVKWNNGKVMGHTRHCDFKKVK